MDENKNTVTNDTNNGTSANNMDYSFNFAEQVAPNESATPVQENAAPQEAVSTPAFENVAIPEVKPVETSAMPEAPAVETPVTPENANVTPEVSATLDTTGTQASVTDTVNATAATDSSVNENVSETTSAPADSSVSTSETMENEVDANSDEDIELIKDKKATKRFLIILFAVIVIFIVALPFIFSVAG